MHMDLRSYERVHDHGTIILHGSHSSESGYKKKRNLSYLELLEMEQAMR